MQPFPKSTPASEILAAIRSLSKPGLGSAKIKSGPWRQRLDSTSDENLLGVSELDDRNGAKCVRSGLLLLADDLDGSHTISQAIQTVEGSYWHGIMHRREKDYSNSKYWFNRVGAHPIFKELGKKLNRFPNLTDEWAGQQSWDPYLMIDTVEECESGRKPQLQDDLMEIQEVEMLLLLAHCYHQATGA